MKKRAGKCQSESDLTVCSDKDKVSKGEKAGRDLALSRYGTAMQVHFEI